MPPRLIPQRYSRRYPRRLKRYADLDPKTRRAIWYPYCDLIDDDLMLQLGHERGLVPLIDAITLDPRVRARYSLDYHAYSLDPLPEGAPMIEQTGWMIWWPDHVRPGDTPREGDIVQVQAGRLALIEPTPFVL